MKIAVEIAKIQSAKSPWQAVAVAHAYLMRDVCEIKIVTLRKTRQSTYTATSSTAQRGWQRSQARTATPTSGRVLVNCIKPAIT